MNNPLKPLLFTGIALLGSTFFSDSAAAQVNNTNKPDYQRNERSIMNDSNFGDFNPLNLIHNANFRRSRDSSEFQQDTRDSINQAAEEFKRQQREQLQNIKPAPAPESK